MAANGFGVFGKYLLGIIVALACLTTACGLIVSVSQYFNRIFPKVSYKAYTIFFTLISFILANLGLNLCNFYVSTSIERHLPNCNNCCVTNFTCTIHSN